MSAIIYPARSPSSDVSDIDRIISDICNEDDPDLVTSGHSNPGKSQLRQTPTQSVTPVENHLK